MSAIGGAFLGRDPELAALESALAEACAGRGRLFFLVGEPGIGKTRLADELCARAGDARVLWGRCWESGGAPAYWPWIEALRPLLDACPPAALAGELGPAAAALAAIVPELRVRLPGLPAVAEDPRWDSEQARFALFDAIARFLRSAAARQPIVLVLDDLHASDRPSLLLLQFVARGLRGARMLVIATYRDADVRLTPDVARLIAGAEREGQRFPLRRLREDEVAAYIASETGVPSDPHLVSAVVRATEGTPLFMREVVRLVVAGGAGALLPGRTLVPDGVQSAIRSHLARASEETRVVLQLAAVIGREFTPAVLRAATDPPVPSAAELEDALAQAARAGLVQGPDAAAGRYRFSHILVRETIYRELGAAERERLHARVAAALESLPETSAVDRLAELSHHHARAGASGDPARAAVICRQAGERALHSYAHEEAAEHFQRALDVGTDGDPEAGAARARAELFLLLAQACQRSGDAARARAACERAAALARRLGDPSLLAGAALQLGAEFVFGLVDSTLVGMLEEALAGIEPGQPALRARLMARLAAARQPAADPEAPIALAAEAVSLARTTGDRRALAAVMRDARAAHLPLDDLDQRLALDLETLALAHETGDSAAIGLTLWRLGGERLEQGDVPAARSHIDQYERWVEEMRQPHRRVWALVARAALASLQGDFAAAARDLDEMEAVMVASRDPAGWYFLWQGRLCNALNATREEDAQRVLPQMEQALARGAIPDSPLLAASLRARVAGDGDVRPIAAWLFARWPARFNAQQVLAEIVVRAGDLAAAGALYQRLLPWAARVTVPWPEGTYAHYLGLLAAALGRTAEAERHFEQAIRQHEKLGARPWIARSQAAYADLLLTARADAAGRRRAEELRAQARATAEALEMPGLLVRLGGAPRKPRAPLAPAAPEPIELVREGEYWAIAFGGSSYRFKDSKGMQIVAYLVRNPGREFHVLHLAGIASGSEAGDALLEEPAGVSPDGAARAAFRERADELREELSEAEANNDPGRASRAREELEQLAEELARGVGLGGRGRRTGGSAERARINIQRRISDALRRIEEACPSLGRRLSRAIHTGAYCTFEGQD